MTSRRGKPDRRKEPHATSWEQFGKENVFQP